MKPKRFQTYITDENLINFLNSQPNIAEYIESTLLKVFNNELVPIEENKTDSSLDRTYKELRNKKLDVDIKIKNKVLEHYEIFGKAPSAEAQRAIETNAKTRRDLTEAEAENVLKYCKVWNDKFNSRLSTAKCNICGIGETYDSRKEALDDMVWHLQTEHSKKVIAL